MAISPDNDGAEITPPLCESSGEKPGAGKVSSLIRGMKIAHSAGAIAGVIAALRDFSPLNVRFGCVDGAARIVDKAGGSLRDVQLLAGHRSTQTTQRYMDGDTDAQRKLVAMI